MEAGSAMEAFIAIALGCMGFSAVFIVIVMLEIRDEFVRIKKGVDELVNQHAYRAVQELENISENIHRMNAR